jgi:lysozyme family protein
VNFDSALGFVLQQEGGFSNRASDRGGATMKGVTQDNYNSYRVGKGLERQDVRLISDDELRDFYLTRYWNATACDKYPGNLALCVFDFAVNSGPGTSIRYLQRALWVTPEDGIAGVDTVAAAKAAPWDRIAWAHLTLRRAFLRSLPDVHVNPGWFNRLNLLRDAVFDGGTNV